MIYCSKCGTQISDDAYFCQKCGTKTAKGRSANALYPTDQLTDALYSVGLELEKALKLAARDTEAAIQKARDNFQAKPTEHTVTCSKCGAKSQSGAVFCTGCGTKIASNGESHGAST